MSHYSTKYRMTHLERARRFVTLGRFLVEAGYNEDTEDLWVSFHNKAEDVLAGIEMEPGEEVDTVYEELEALSTQVAQVVDPDDDYMGAAYEDAAYC